MQTEIQTGLGTLRFGAGQSHHHLTVPPLHGAANGAPPYIGLADAMSARTLTVTEASDQGGETTAKLASIRRRRRFRE